MPVSTDHGYSIKKAGKDFKWRGEKAPKLPLIQAPDGSLFEPLVKYFGESFRYRRVQISSMLVEAYILKDWFTYLNDNNIDWKRVRDQTIVDWRSHLNEADRKSIQDGDRIEIDSKNRINRKIDVVFTFYFLCGPDDYGIMDCLLVDLIGPITLQRRNLGSRWISQNGTFHIDDGAKNVRWALAEQSKQKVTQEPTPDQAAVAKVLSYLRTPRQTDETDAQSRGRPTDPLTSERNWLVGICAVKGGFRALEIEAASVISAGIALNNSNIQIPDARSMPDFEAPGTRVRHPLDLLAYSKMGQTALLREIELRARQGYSNIWMPVDGKGGKRRDVSLANDVFLDLLTIGIWLVRKAILVGHATKLGSDPLSNSIFLPFGVAPMEGLSRKTIGNILKSAFHGAGVLGSGHRLRAYWASETCARLWDEAFALNGFKWDQTVENAVLHDLARAMGHVKVSTTVRSYLDRELIRSLGLKDKRSLSLLRKAANTIAENQNSLSKVDFERIMIVIKRLADSDLEFGAVLDVLLSDPDFKKP
ncbi:hypothetical protein [Sphingobium yanoikuyae]|uniref:hypothetical protein n=1 Tax=Sphingobium yanoikuyae TaxID=13690 RepID=UPI0028A66504|nr:hypothetical protein [Sphingobium yanoikuyae]